ncbi:MAG: hypothetical protein Q9176_003903 [Flavoplaca citrina]
MLQQFRRNFKVFAALVDLVEERANFYKILSVKNMNGSDDRYGTNKWLGIEDIDKTDDIIGYRDYDKGFQNELLEREYLSQWSGGMNRLGNLLTEDIRFSHLFIISLLPPSPPSSTFTTTDPPSPKNPPVSSTNMVSSIMVLFDYYSPPRTQPPNQPPHPEAAHLFSLSPPRRQLNTSAFNWSLNLMEANLKFLKKLVDVVDERATCFENLSRGAESLATILEDTLTLRQEWGARFCAASVENEDIEAVAQNSVDVGDDENINNERLIKEELSRWSGDMVVLGDLCRKWQNDVYHETIEELLNDGVHPRSR